MQRPRSFRFPFRRNDVIDAFTFAEPVSWEKLAAEEPKSTNCFYEGKAKKVGERWQASDCMSCVCEEEGSSCQMTMCKPCENSIPPDPGECCPHCPANGTLSELEPPCPTSLDGCGLACEHGFVNDLNNCPTCSCVEKKVRRKHRPNACLKYRAVANVILISGGRRHSHRARPPSHHRN